MTFEELEQKVIQWGKDRNLYDPIQGTTVFKQQVKLLEEQSELLDALLGIDQTLVADAIGDMLVVLTHIAKLAGLDLQICYNQAYKEIKDRKGMMINGIFVKEK
jgi:NTP pyrophosphatase (non-canonical NTP hydrolase)